MPKLIALAAFLTGLLCSPAAFAQIPSGPGQMPGTLPPAPPVMVLPPPVAPAPVPSAVTPIPSPSYGVPPGVTRPVIGGTTSVYRVPIDHPPKKKKPSKKRHPRVSEILFVSTI